MPKGYIDASPYMLCSYLAMVEQRAKNRTGYFTYNCRQCYADDRCPYPEKHQPKQEAAQ